MIHHALRADARANRERLIDAAHEVFRERGMDAEMKVIAERAGVGVGTIYRNFPAKEDLIVAIAAQMVEEVKFLIVEVSAIDDPVDALRHMLASGLHIVDSYGDIALAALHQDLPPPCQELFASFDKGAFVSDILRRGVAAGRFRANLNIPVTAIAIESTLNPAHYQHLRGALSPEQVVDAYTDLFLRGMLAE